MAKEETYGETEDRLKARALRLRWVAHAKKAFPEVVVRADGTELFCLRCGRYTLSHPAECEED